MLNFEKEMKFSLNSEDEVTQICKPLFDYSPITIFEYKVVFYDGYMIDLNNISKMAPVYYYENLFPTIAELEMLQSRYIFVSVNIGVPEILKEYEDK
ncbi:MAG: hypothetical protein JSS53_08615 [Proteobacteria bacterium]|nr:hypothetical protein [Pseudomonadota bacterium]